MTIHTRYIQRSQQQQQYCSTSLHLHARQSLHHSWLCTLPPLFLDNHDHEQSSSATSTSKLPPRYSSRQLQRCTITTRQHCQEAPTGSCRSLDRQSGKAL